MDIIHIIILALVQGVTEFLPVSSSAHLILVPVLTNWEDQGLAFDVALHVGTLLAVMYYFKHELHMMGVGWSKSLYTTTTEVERGNARLAWAVILATIPVGLAGLIFNGFIEENLRSPLVVATASIFFGIILWLADRFSKKEKTEYQMTWKIVLFIGSAQVLALIPGTSRSGATITAGLLLGLTRQAAARFSFLLSIPTITMAGGFLTLELIKSHAVVDWFSLFLAVVISASSALLCIHYFLKLLDVVGMTPFVIYRILLGILLLVIFL